MAMVGAASRVSLLPMVGKEVLAKRVHSGHQHAAVLGCPCMTMSAVASARSFTQKNHLVRPATHVLSSKSSHRSAGTSANDNKVEDPAPVLLKGGFYLSDGFGARDAATLAAMAVFLELPITAFFDLTVCPREFLVVPVLALVPALMSGATVATLQSMAGKLGKTGQDHFAPQIAAVLQDMKLDSTELQVLVDTVARYFELAVQSVEGYFDPAFTAMLTEVRAASARSAINFQKMVEAAAKKEQTLKQCSTELAELEQLFIDFEAEFGT